LKRSVASLRASVRAVVLSRSAFGWVDGGAVALSLVVAMKYPFVVRGVERA
jgi:hypothetical protein